MKDTLKKSLRYSALFFAVIGPGLITAVADNDAGGVATYTVAAAMFGMASQFLIIPTTVLLAITQEIGARLAIVTGKGLGSLIRERYGVRTAVVMFLFYFVVNQGVVLQNITGLKASLQLFNLPWELGLAVACLLLCALIILLDYKKLQRIFLVMILFYVAYLATAFLVHPDWHDALRESLVWPRHISIKNPFYWFSLIAVLGTTVTAWGQFFISSFVVDKGLSKKDIKINKIEIFTGAFLTNFFSWMIAIAVTYTLFTHGIKVSDGFSAAQALRPLAGNFSYLLFAFGLFGASILGLSIVPLATAYVFTEMFGYERTLNVNFREGKIFYIFFILQIILGLLITLAPKLNLFNLTIYADYLNGAILPFIFYFLIKFSEDKELMGEYYSRGFTKYFLRFAAVGITIAILVTSFGRLV